MFAFNLFKNNIRSIFQDNVWFIDFSAIYFSGKRSDGRSSKDFIFSVILVVVMLLVVVVPGVYIIFLWRKVKKRKKGNVIIEVDVIHVYCGLISFSGYDLFWSYCKSQHFRKKFFMDNVSINTLYS